MTGGTFGHGTLVTVATCNLNQWALDFDGNCDRILESCRRAKAAGASYRLGPELEISGYGCEDHFLESDTFSHCWETLAKLLEEGATDDGMLCDFGMPVLFAGARYNCRILAMNRKILLIRPKSAMADNGNYRESRYFTAYRATGIGPEELILPEIFKEKFQQRSAPFGTQFLQLGDGICVGCESCEELWTPQATHIDLALQGVEIIGNGSGSHHELRKLNQRLELIQSATRKCGGVYLYANQRGCDGGRLYFDGGALIVCNGNVLAQAPQFSLDDVEVVTATVDLDDIRSYRASIPSFGIQSALSSHERKSSAVNAPADCKIPVLDSSNSPTSPVTATRFHSPEEECLLGPACWLWDYLRRSGAAGFFLPLSGGADSSSVAAIVGAMCCMVTEAAKADPDGPIANDCRKICRQEAPWVPQTPQEMGSYVLHTTYMGTENSSEATTSRAKRLGESLGSYHLAIKIDLMVSAVIQVFAATFGKTPRFTAHGGTTQEDLALQNIQARLRMVTAYLFAQLLPWVRGRTGFLLVLGSANVDEGLRGYMTKYDCSSADLNPIGAISKGDLKKMLLWASKRYEWDVLAEIAGAPPTAELRPIADSNASEDAEHSQLDEEEMGMTYAELGMFGKLRKLSRCGPVSMFRKLCVSWAPTLSPREVAVKVKRFFFFYSVNRHKMCTITPAYHAEGYSPDDNRFDLRQFLYNVKWPRQFAVIDQLVEESEKGNDDKKNT
uniref:Glutamine-dependent NAD(+) synthetase n=1 Tax=Entomoneis paludosa TaxID=265537 RepID=A0A6U2XUR6_9STRA|mmetsp:Transcript_14544/g.30034  ORF Transcript_14544/g.30034 Transcript_14544/m.30034 type:complete len:728 (+) Transcript_14544:171-2354(+)|eukprot:CAMPEP_0172444330 /NCGR_PEP_ID=MMETSP1065-20121228/4387_1 /TAXON_ID=265537 /ORGANISM="Amphiprora paludosa, Strain CCMP125" /LENGTH=727 /DNA_ID=CAMNT_0013194819 /DNA_START=123 /DNA_END=2306 /DNA_ORIENTATION=+